MSWQAHKAVLQFSESRGAARCILHVLADHADAQGLSSFPSWNTIQAKANVSRGSIKPALEHLLELGEIEQTGLRPSGTKVWRIHLGARGGSGIELLDKDSGSGIEPPDPYSPGTPSSIPDAGGSIPDTSGSIRGAGGSGIEPEPSFEPSFEPSERTEPEFSVSDSGLKEEEAERNAMAELQGLAGTGDKYASLALKIIQSGEGDGAGA